MKNQPPFFKKGDGYFLSLDIGTQTIKVLICKKEEKKIVIFGGSIVSLEPIAIIDSPAFRIEALRQTILNAIQDAKQISASREVTKQKTWLTFLGLPPHILKGRVSHQNFKRENPGGKIKRKEEEIILKSVISSSYKNIAQLVSKEAGLLANDIRFLETKVLSIKIDGYKVPQILGFSGEYLEFRILNNLLLKSYLSAIDKVFRKWDLKILKIVSPMENLPLALQDTKIDGFFLDIGGKTSQIALVYEGEIYTITEFPVGGEIFSHQLSEILGIGEPGAEDLKIRYSQRLLSEEVRTRIKEIFSPAAQFWFSSLKLQLKKHVPSQDFKLLPSSVLFFGGSSQLPEIEDVVTNGNWEDLIFPERTETKILLPKDLKNFQDQTKIINTPQYIPSLLICYDA